MLNKLIHIFLFHSTHIQSQTTDPLSTTDQVCITSSSPTISGTYKYHSFDIQSSGPIYHNTEQNKYLYPWQYSDLTAHYLISTNQFTNTPDSYCQLPSTNTPLNPDTCFSSWFNSDAVLVNCNDICISGSTHFFLEGSYHWMHFNVTTDSSVYFCDECNPSAYLFGYIFTDTNGIIHHNWRIGPHYPNPAAWSSCVIEGKGANYVFDLEDCNGWDDAVRGQWIDQDIIATKCNTNQLNFPASIATLPPTSDTTNTPTVAPSESPTKIPSINPTFIPSDMPTKYPKSNPSKFPTQNPTVVPSDNPTKSPSTFPTSNPSFVPSENPTKVPSNTPSASPSFGTMFPSVNLTINPSVRPSEMPTKYPTMYPSANPSKYPSKPPTQNPTKYPSTFPTSDPTFVPSENPTKAPSLLPSANPTSDPSITPSVNPTYTPTNDPTANPSLKPTHIPTVYPSQFPTDYPSVTPSLSPSKSPILGTMNPSISPTKIPTFPPSVNPSMHPTQRPTPRPSRIPSEHTINPTYSPSTSPTYTPTQMSRNPTTSPTQNPTAHPTRTVTINPTLSPTTTLTPTAISINPTQSPFPSMQPTANRILTTNIIISTHMNRISPTYTPTQMSPNPTTLPTQNPTAHPTRTVTINPTRYPTTPHTRNPTVTVTINPTLEPTATPTLTPTAMSINPTQSPFPSMQPTTNRILSTNIIISTHMNLNNEYIAFSLSNADLSCEGYIEFVGILDSSVDHTWIITDTHNNEGFYEFAAVDQPWVLPISIQISKKRNNEDLEVLQGENIIYSFTPGLLYDFGDNFCSVIGRNTIVQRADGYYSLDYAFYYLVIAICFVFIVFAMIAVCDAKCCHKNDYFELSLLWSSLVSILTMMSYIFFINEVWLYLYLSNNSLPFILIFSTAIATLIVPMLVSIMVIYCESVTQYWIFNDRVRDWMAKYTELLYFYSVITGSAFTAMDVFNSNLFGLELFYLGLPKQRLLSFQIKKLYFIVLCSNVPQFALTLLFCYVSSMFGFIAFLSLLFSLLSIITSIANAGIAQLRFRKCKNDYLYITLEIEGKCVANKSAKLCHARMRNIQTYLCQSVFGMKNVNSVQVMRPYIYDTLRKGLQLQIHIAYNNKSEKSEANLCDKYEDLLHNSIESGGLPQIIKSEWKLVSPPKIKNILCQFVTATVTMNSSSDNHNNNGMMLVSNEEESSIGNQTDTTVMDRWTECTRLETVDSRQSIESVGVDIIY